MLRRRLEVKKQAFRQLGEEDGHEKNEGKEGEGQAGAPRRLHHAQGDPGGASCPAVVAQTSLCWPRGPAAARARRSGLVANGTADRFSSPR